MNNYITVNNENYLPYSHLVKIITFLPIEKITERHIQFIDDALNTKWDTELKPKKIKKKIDSYIQSKHPIFRRLAIYTIKRHYNDLKDIFWKFESNPLEDYQAKLELYELLKAHAKQFTNEQLERILYWIENSDYYLADEDIADREMSKKIIAYKKKEWLTALSDIQRSMVITRFEKYDKINPAKVDHPGHDLWFETWSETTGPKSGEEMLEMSNKEIADFLLNFKPELNEIKAPTVEGLSAELRGLVMDHPQKFTDEMSPFLKVPPIYIERILWGLYEACKNKIDFSWEKVVGFIRQFIERKSTYEQVKTLSSIDWINAAESAILSLLEEGLEGECEKIFFSYFRFG